MNSVRAGSLYPAASAAALLLLCGVDVVAVSGQRSPKFVLILAVLATSVGALQGLCWAAVLSVSARLPGRVRVLSWSLAGIAGASFVRRTPQPSKTVAPFWPRAATPSRR